MAKGKGTGFLAAFVIAVVSFFVIFFFFTDVSYKYFGVSFKGAPTEEETGVKKLESTIDSAVMSVLDAATEAVTEVVTDAVKKTDISSLIGTPSGNE